MSKADFMGIIDGYIMIVCTMDCPFYKLGTWLDDIKERLSPEDWEKRGKAMLEIYENEKVCYEEGLRSRFHEILLAELTGARVED